ncbi:hypothetical protein LJR219_004831 [Phenylobacterium sp. LjRoot219]|uniref:hypothetical protein n=1 Tax=Phenylobacterium sp. LjRoot219 TaxID=3342283 RepID=UPI003ED0B8CC
MTRQVGSAQKRALVELAETTDGIGEVPFKQAPGLMNKGLVTRLGRANSKPTAPYVCQLTEAGREFVRELGDRAGTGEVRAFLLAQAA